jgi:hypothetical protein
MQNERIEKIYDQEVLKDELLNISSTSNNNIEYD